MASGQQRRIGDHQPMDRTIDHAAVLIVDIAGTVALRRDYGDSAAGRRIRHLLDKIIAESRARGGLFIKSYGDDVLVVFEDNAVQRAAESAIAAQRLAAEAGLQLYAGLHTGPVSLSAPMGHPVADGQTVNIAARLHKLADDAPGQIFLSGDSVEQLPHELKSSAMRFGARNLKGLGTMEIWTLEWRNNATLITLVTTFADTGDLSFASRPLHLRHQSRELLLPCVDGVSTLGRASDCTLRIPDPEPRISAKHLLLQHSAGHWFAQDISRNGTWLRDGQSGETTPLPCFNKATLPRRGALCLGRPFELDIAGHYVVEFELSAS